MRADAAMILCGPKELGRTGIAKPVSARALCQCCQTRCVADRVLYWHFVWATTKTRTPDALGDLLLNAVTVVANLQGFGDKAVGAWVWVPTKQARSETTACTDRVHDARFPYRAALATETCQLYPTRPPSVLAVTERGQTSVPTR